MLPRRSPPCVLLTVEPPGLVWPHVDSLVRGLSGLGAEVVVCAITPLRPGQRIEYAGVPGVELIPCPAPAATAAEHLDRRRRIADWLLGIEEMINPDVVHLTGYLHAGLPWSGKVLVAGYPGSGAAYGRLDADRRRASAAAFRHGLAGADLVVAPSEAMLGALARHFGVASGRVIRDGRDPTRYAPAPVKEPLVLAAGRVRDDATRVSAIERVAPGLAWPVVVAGDQADDCGRHTRLQNVSALGRLHPSLMVPWFNRASIYAALTAEGAGTFVPEAALAGAAPVLGDTAPLRELWSGAALFAAQDDDEAVAAALRTLIADRRLREAVGFAARRRALRNTQRIMAESYLAAYRDLIAGRAPDQFAPEKRWSNHSSA